MIFFRKIIGAFIFGLAFFIFEVVAIIVLGYIFAQLKGLKYNFHDALIQGIHSGLYLGAVVAILAFIGTPRRGPPF